MNKTPKGSTVDVFQKTFFPKFELLNSGCSLSVGEAYLQVFTVFSYRKRNSPLYMQDLTATGRAIHLRMGKQLLYHYFVL